MFGDIEDYPAAEVKPVVRGEWIYGYDEQTGERDLYPLTCSVCGEKHPWTPPYCPFCGADMRGGEDEHTN